jgi:hypothetical protein
MLSISTPLSTRYQTHIANNPKVILGANTWTWVYAGHSMVWGQDLEQTTPYGAPTMSLRFYESRVQVPLAHRG